jgi:ADP-heptose:LPS heptosyltransferase
LPYLTADPERCIQWRALFDTFKGKKIGIGWRGGLPNTGMKKRSLELEDFEPLLNDHDTFISLEYKPVDQSELYRYGIKSYPRATAKGVDIDDLAALVNELDLVVTACTTTVYVAGALGIPCIVLVPDQPGYRYHLQGDFPWYNSVNLVRQMGTWRETIERLIKRELAA